VAQCPILAHTAAFGIAPFISRITSCRFDNARGALTWDRSVRAEPGSRGCPRGAGQGDRSGAASSCLGFRACTAGAVRALASGVVWSRRRPDSAQTTRKWEAARETLRSSSNPQTSQGDRKKFDRNCPILKMAVLQRIHGFGELLIHR
jgi:hypothetical protein